MPDLSVAVGERPERVVEGDPQSARVRAAGRVRPSGEDVAWVLADLAPSLGGAEVLTLRAGPELLRDSEFRWAVDGLDVFAHFVDAADAARVAGMFGLVGVDGLRDGWVWRSWSGWDADASRCGFPVWVSFTACVVRGAAVSAGALAGPVPS